MKQKIRVVMSGLIFPWTMMHLFWRAFERRDDIDLFVTGPFFDDWTPWCYGMKLPRKYVKYPNLGLPTSSANARIDPLLVELQMPEEKRNPDLWLQVDAGFHFSRRPNADVVALVETDPHVLKASYELPKSYSDKTFCMQMEYMVDGECYLPYAYDPEIHYPEPETKKIYDACLIGLHYEQRTELVNALIKKGYKVQYSIGEIYDEYRHLYNQSKIALSWSTLKDMPSRVWEAFGMGNLLVTNRVPDLKNFFVEYDHYLGFDDTKEAVEKVEWALSNWHEAEMIAEAGHRKVFPHSWDARISEILETCKLI